MRTDMPVCDTRIDGLMGTVTASCVARTMGTMTQYGCTRPRIDGYVYNLDNVVCVTQGSTGTMTVCDAIED
jgi:hypothetical protein